MIRVVICDDNEQDRFCLWSMLKNCALPLEIAEYAGADALLEDIETGNAQFDLYFLDIYLSGISGVEAARRIRDADGNALLVFVSSSEEFYREAFDLYALNYLIKPVEQSKLDTVMKKAVDELSQLREQLLPITSHGHTYLLRYDEIEYIFSRNHALYFHMTSGEEKSCYGKLDDVALQLKSDVFVRCHQSYIVNLAHVSEHMPGNFCMKDTVVPISRAYSNAAQTALHRYLFNIFDEN